MIFNLNDIFNAEIESLLFFNFHIFYSDAKISWHSWSFSGWMFCLINSRLLREVQFG